MPDTAADVDDLAHGDGPFGRLCQRQLALEERVGKLETLAVPLQPPVEDAVVERVIAKLSTEPPAAVADRVLVLPSADPPPPPPSGAVPHPPGPATDSAAKGWFVFQFIAELRLALHMYFDPRYRISRTTQFAVPGIVLLLVFNYFLFAVWMSIPFVNPLLERVADFVLVVIGYKLLERELVRYREVLDYLARYGHPHDPTWR
jgi:hypothetical protein